MQAVNASLKKYVRHVADLMHMKDWEIDLLTDPPKGSEDAVATSQTPCTYAKYVRLWFNPVIWDRSPLHERRFSVVHELAHAALKVVDANDDHTAQETTVEWVTRLLELQMPLPPKAARA
jgi:hypothetical protein